MGYLKTTDKQYKVYCLDFEYIQQANVVHVNKLVKGEKIDLQI